PVAVVNTDAAYQYLGRLVIDFDDNGVIIPESYDPDLSGAFATDDAGVERVGAEGLADPEIVAITAAVEEEIVSGESVFFAVTDVFLNGERAGGPIDGVRTQETNLGNLTADANLEYARQFDETVVVSYKNGGGIRANIGSIVVPGGDEDPQRLPPEGVPGAKPEGGISQNDVQNTLAFNNGLTLLSLDTAQLVNVLESTVSSWESIDAGSGGFGQYSGVQFSFDPSLEPGSRIVNAGVFAEDGTLIAQLVVDGELVDNGDQTFRTVTLDFLADGGGPGLPVTNPEEDGFDADIAAATNRVDLVDSENPTFTGPATFSPDGGEQDALAEYLLENFGNEEGDPTFSIADTPVEEDERIQNLSFREDTVFGASDGGGGDGVSEIRVATFNASLERSAEGELISDLSTGDNAQAQNVAQIIQQTNADIILINEFDFDENGEAAALFQQNYLSVSQGGEDPVEYPFVYVAPTNTGVDSGLDLNGDGETGTANDAFGFGTYPGEFGFIILSKYEIDEPNIRTFQEFLWQDMPDSLLLADTDDSEPLTELLDDDAIAGFRLSSKNHVDLPVIVDGETVHVLAAHPTPPVFDDPTFDLNGKRNADEIRFWADYVAGEDYITDDAGVSGGLAEGSRFVI
ncbi:MAG: 5'-nucleotidase C-terminal domain-containing protein, partial [Planctomycetota bacterium]